MHSEQFAKPPLEKPAFRGLPGQLERPLVGLSRVFGVTEAPAQVGPGRVREVVIIQITGRKQGIDKHQAFGGTVTHGARFIEPRTPAQHINRFEPSGRNQPGARIVGHPFGRPLFERRGERVVKGRLGEIEITEVSPRG